MNQRGQVYPLFGFLILSVMALSALTIDMGYYRYQQRAEQTAADSAALAGGQADAFASPNAQNAAVADAATNGFASPNATVSVDPNYSDAYTTNSAGAVKVTISKPYQKWFSGFFGGGPQNVSASAVAALQQIGDDCITALDPTQQMTMNGQKFDGSGCIIASNATLNCNGGDYSTVAGITVDESTNGGFGGCKSGPTPGFTELVPDPCPNVTGCLAMEGLDGNALGLTCNPNTVNSTCTAPACQHLAVAPAANGVAPVGCYDGSSTGNVPHGFASGVTFKGGPYVFVNGVQFGSGANTDPAGAVFYIASGSFNVGQDLGSASTVFSGPSSGTYAGLLFFQPKVNTTATVLGANLYTQGMWYFPGADYTENGHHTHSYVGDIVYAGMTFNGGNTTIINPGPDNTAFSPKIAVLVE